MRYMSPARRREMKSRKQLRERKIANQSCAASIPDVCVNRGPWEVNEVIRRSQWPLGYLVEGNTDCLCQPCHRYVTGNPLEAEELGLQRKSTDRPQCEVGDCDAGADALVEDDGLVAWVCRRHVPVVDVAVSMGLLVLRAGRPDTEEEPDG